PAVLLGRRLHAAATLSGELPAALRGGGALRGGPDRQRLPPRRPPPPPPRRLRAAVRAAGAQDVLLPAERSQSERTHHGSRNRTAPADRGRTVPGPDRRGRLRRQPILSRARGNRL